MKSSSARVPRTGFDQSSRLAEPRGVKRTDLHSRIIRLEPVPGKNRDGREAARNLRGAGVAEGVIMKIGDWRKRSVF